MHGPLECQILKVIHGGFYCTKTFKTLLYASTNISITHGYMFRPFKQSSSGLLTD